MIEHIYRAQICQNLSTVVPKGPLVALIQVRCLQLGHLWRGNLWIQLNSRKKTACTRWASNHQRATSWGVNID